MKNLIITITSIAMLWGCTSKDELYKGNFEGKEYRFQQVTKNQGFNKAYSQTLKIETVSNVLHIDDKNTSPGYPYSFDMYKGVLHIILDSVSYQYKNGYDNTAKDFAVLYVHPNKFSKEDFEVFSKFFQNEWQNIKSKVPLNQGYRTLQIVALVYGTDEQFTHRFENGKQSIEVWTDGQVNYSSGAGSVQSINLSEKIQMPGKKIYVSENGQFTMDELRAFRNKKDKPLEMEFDVMMK